MNPRRPASICSAACMGILAVVGSGSCGRSRVDSNYNVPPPTGVERQTLDEAVIEAALVDLVTGTDIDSETLRQEQGPGTLLFSGKSRDWVGTLNQELASAELEKWKSIGSSDRDAAKEAASVVTNRMANKQHFTVFRPKDSRISLWEDDPASTQPAERGSFNRRRPISAAPPGYGDQNRLAVAVFSVAWSMHGGDATYVLRFDGTTWHVISRHFSYYV